MERSMLMPRALHLFISAAVSTAEQTSQLFHGIVTCMFGDEKCCKGKSKQSSGWVTVSLLQCTYPFSRYCFSMKQEIQGNISWLRKSDLCIYLLLSVMGSQIFWTLTLHKLVAHAFFFSWHMMCFGCTSWYYHVTAICICRHLWGLVFVPYISWMLHLCRFLQTLASKCLEAKIHHSKLMCQEDTGS